MIALCSAGGLEGGWGSLEEMDVVSLITSWVLELEDRLLDKLVSLKTPSDAVSSLS